MNFEIKASADKAIIRIQGEIRGWVNGSDEFFNQIENLKSQGINDVIVYINSPGGDVFEANEIANLILQFPGKIEFELGALCASAATVIIAEVFSRRGNIPVRMHRNGQFMIHRVRAYVSGTIPELESAIKLMKNLEDNAVKSYAQMTGIKERQIRKMMEAETWLTAQEALEKGFITEIIDSPQNENNIKVENIKNDKQMKLIAEHIGIENPTEQDVINYINDLKQKLEEERRKNQRQQKQLIEALIDKAISEGRINENERDEFIALAQKDFETTKSLLEKRPVKTLSSFIRNDNPTIENHNWDWYMKNDPETLNRLMNENPKLFKALYKDKFGVEPKL